MTTFIDIGPVPNQEAVPSEPQRAMKLAAAFLRQLNRLQPLPSGVGARYCVAQSPPGKLPWVTVQLAVKVNSWDSADGASDLASRALSVQRWDTQAMQELQSLQLEPTPTCEPTPA